MEFEFNNKRVVLTGHSETDEIYQRIKFSHSFYELDMLSYVLRCHKKQRTAGSMVIDVGANIGNHSVFFGLFVAGFVLAIEPNPPVFEVLTKNLTQNGVNALPLKLALSDQSGKGEIIEHAADNVGMAQVSMLQGVTVSEDDVDVETLDRVFHQYVSDDRTVSLIKIDVEGAERDVIQGSMAVIAAYKPDLYIEIQDPVKLQEIQALLSGHNYQVVSKWGATTMYHLVSKPTLQQRFRGAAFWMSNLCVR
ncbi:MAG: FkbM family methyltransferase, partial [Pseudomonadota bacterium]